MSSPQGPRAPPPATPPGVPQLPGSIPEETALALPSLPEVPPTTAQLPVAIPKMPPPPPNSNDRQLAMLGSANGGSRDALTFALAPFENPALSPLRNVPTTTGRLPPLPKNAPLQLPKQMLASIPAIAKDSGNALPPPPPPPVGGFGALATLPVPPTDGEPEVHRGLQVYRAPPRRGGQTATSKAPRPPAKLPAARLQPTPPAMPPPAHAIVLARKAGVPGFDQDTVVAKARVPSPVPKPPGDPPPQNIRRDIPVVDPKAVDEIAKQRKEKDIIDGVPDPFAASRKDPRGFFEMSRQAHDEKAPTPVPDYVVQSSFYLVNFFVACTILADVSVISIWGTYLPPSAVYPTYAATLIGIFVNHGLYESVKCVVIACIAMVHDETDKRDQEVEARKARMEIKAQRFIQRGRKIIPSTT